MAGVGTSWRRSLLLAASVLLPVAVAVAGNQILNDGVWSWWWVVIAVALTTASTLVTYGLTRTAMSDTGQDDHPQPAAPPTQLPPAPATQMQLNLPAAGGTVNAVQGGTMNIHHSGSPARPSDGGQGPSS